MKQLGPSLGNVAYNSVCWVSMYIEWVHKCKEALHVRSFDLGILQSSTGI